MPNSRRRFAKKVAPISNPPKIHINTRLGFQPVSRYLDVVPHLPQPLVWLMASDNGGKIGLRCLVQPDFLPALLELAQPESTRETCPFADSVPFFSSILPNLLPYLLELAQPEHTRETYTVGLDTSSSDKQLFALIIEAEKFPLTVEQFLDVTYLISPAVSNNLFQELGMAKVWGMNYHDRIWRQLTWTGRKKTTNPKRKNTRPLTKSYVEQDTGQYGKPRFREPSFWDLLYIILQPPITLEQLENLYLPHNLFPYQPAGIEFLMNNESALLADEMGTGKTVMTAVAIRILVQKGLASSALIVCPLSVLREWRRHLDEWSPDLLVTFVRGTQAIRKRAWEIKAHVYVTTYDTLRSDINANLLPITMREQFDIVVLDEAQSIKNPGSGRSRAIRKLKARQRWALTGTPIENRLEDIHALFDFLRPGYLSPIDLYLGGIKDKIAPYLLRRRKADVLPDLPTKQKQDIWLELDREQRAEYDKAISRVRHELTELGVRVSQLDIMRSIQLLKQICNFASDKHTSPKLDFLKEQLEDITQSGQKVIVFSQYLGAGINRLEEALKPYGTTKIVGGQSESARNIEIERFKHSAEFPILLVSVQAGGVGLNLTEASYVIHFDHLWNPATMWQAEARVHRPGQTRGVNVYSYWMADTIEERIYKILQNKGLLFKDVVDSLSETQIDESISTAEWLQIFGIEIKQEVLSQPKRQTFIDMSLLEIREHLFGIAPEKFEQLVKELIHSLGFSNVKVTNQTKDGGIDVISTRNTSEGIVRVVAQCKRYRGTVGVEAARELRGVIAEDLSIAQGFLVTTGEFSQECLAFCARSNGLITPISGLEVAKYIKYYGLAV